MRYDDIIFALMLGMVLVISGTIVREWLASVVATAKSHKRAH